MASVRNDGASVINAGVYDVWIVGHQPSAKDPPTLQFQVSSSLVLCAATMML